jgi:hypothetical protein
MSLPEKCRTLTRSQSRPKLPPVCYGCHSRSTGAINKWSKRYCPLSRAKAEQPTVLPKR